MLTHAVLLNGYESRLILIWMLISCISHLTALPLKTQAHTRTHLQQAQGLEGGRLRSYSPGSWRLLRSYLPMVRGQCGMCSTLAHVPMWTRLLKVDKAGLVCTSVQLRGPQRVDEVLIRALTAGVRRSEGDARFWLGPWEPDGARGHEGSAAAEGRSTVTRLISLGQCTPHAFLFCFCTWAHTQIHTHLIVHHTQTIARGLLL